MGATEDGNKKTKAAMIKKYGSMDDYRKHMAEIGAMGGKREVAKGLSMTRRLLGPHKEGNAT